MNDFQKSQSQKILASYGFDFSKYEDLDLIKGRGKTALIGEIREFGGVKHVKHTDGWVILNKEGKAHKFYNSKTREKTDVTKDHQNHAAKHLAEVDEEYTPKIRTSTKEIAKPNYRYPSSIASLGSINLKTGSSKYFNIYDTWGEDTTYQIYDMNHEYSDKKEPKLRIVATSGKKPIGDIGDKEAFQSDQSRRDLGEGKMIDYATGSQLKKLAAKYGNSIQGFTYK